ncbi:ferritin-like domain-containing protein [Thermoflavimicrobium daqui]|uniref:Bacterioferritin n=1 Tax=Thermoflavimicrobium daqui TaxID=2137476 RepID=A0A364K6B4_9BACL|nr:ferritin-like domain-containing protein [Thermoflavimicrobium daqui]RAL25752.1 bacterioferritin [Thermoflavimicrobium daqui]
MNANMQELIAGLNEDLAYELSAIHQYIYNAAVVSGMARLTLKDFFTSEAQDEIGHALYLAEKVATLGGKPNVEAKPIQFISDVKGMLQATLQAERDTIERYKTRIEQSEQLGEIELKIKLEEMLADETKHKEEIERLLIDPRL